MVKITYIESNGRVHLVDASSCETVMEGAVKNGVPGILAACGGACSCATCHVYIDECWAERAGSANPMEAEMLPFALDVQSASRLSCQIKISAALDGLVVKIPERQQ